MSTVRNRYWKPTPGVSARILWNILLGGVLLFSSFPIIYAQRKTYPEQPDEFIEFLVQHARNIQDKAFQAFLDTFQTQWQTTMDSTEQMRVIHAMRFMEKRRMPFSPYQKTYLKAVGRFFRSGQPIDQSFFVHWHQYVDSFLQNLSAKTQPRYLAFLRFSEAFFRELALYRGANRLWKIENPSVRIDWDPQKKDVRVVIPRTKLIGITINDTLELYDVSGSFYPSTGQFEVRAARIYWENYPSDQIYLQLPHFTMNVKRAGFTVDSAIYVNKELFPKPLVGRFEARLVAQTGPKEKIQARKQRVTYPRFFSYDKNLRLRPHPLMDFEGGIGILGKQLVGYAPEKGFPAQLYIYRSTKDRKKNKPFMVLRAEYFRFVPQRSIIANPCAVSIHLTDSHEIRHPGVLFRADLMRNQIYLIRQKEGLGASAFLDTYHQVEFMPQQITWHVGSDTLSLEVAMGTGQIKMPVVSLDYYDEVLYMDYMRATNYHPLGKLALHALETGAEEFTEEEVARVWNPRLSVEAIRPLLFRMVQDGFIDYDPEYGVVRIRPKLIFYLRANQKRTDYDYLFLESQDRDPQYGYIVLSSLDLIVEGVKYVMLSQRQASALFPADRRVILRKNRDILIKEGGFIVGRFRFWGKNLQFYYDQFAVDVGLVDSLVIHLPTGEYTPDGKPITYPVRSAIEDLQVIVYIDAPFNKSGRHKLLRYPIMKTKGPSYIYYDKPSIHGGAYTRDRFFVRLDPFVFDSINSFKPEALAFSGTFVSGGILPEQRVTIRLRPDTSLGFTMDVPEGGFPFYEGRGTLQKGKIDLSNRGLLIFDAQMQFSHATVTSPQFLCLLETMESENAQVQITEQAEHPDVEGLRTRVSWRPYQYTLALTTVDSPALLYRGEVTYEGTMEYRPERLSGFGKVRVREAEMISPLFVFENPEFWADTAAVFFYTTDTALLALQSPHVRFRVNMQERKAHFESNYGEFITEYILNRYKTNFNVYDWFMDDKRLEFYSSEGEDDYGYFVSTDPRRDSLYFSGLRAIYHLQTRLLTVRGVNYIPVADARIYPGDSTVRVFPGGNMERLLHARIVVDTTHEAHHILNAEVQVVSRFRYHGKGWYPYQHPFQSDSQYIRVDTIYTWLDTSGTYSKDQPVTWHTYGLGWIPDSPAFYLYPQIRFTGKLHIRGPIPLPEFEGYAWFLPQHKGVSTRPFSFQDTINPQRFILPFKDARTPGNKIVSAGIHLHNVSYNLYTNVTDGKREPHDQDIFHVEGWLTYNPETYTLRIHPVRNEQVRLTSRLYPYFTYNDLSGLVQGYGSFHLFRQRGLVTLYAGGTVEHPMDSIDYTFRTAIAFQMPIDPSVLDAIRNSFMMNGGMDLAEALWDDPTLQAGILFLTEDSAERRKWLERFELQGTWKPSWLPHAFLLANLELHWDTATHTFYHVGPAILVSINGKEIMRQVQVLFALSKRRGGDNFTLFIEISPEMWYFIRYRNNICDIYSPDPSVPKSITELKRKQRLIKDRETRRMFRLMLSTEQTAIRFKQRFLGRYGKEEEAQK